VATERPTLCKVRKGWATQDDLAARRASTGDLRQEL